MLSAEELRLWDHVCSAELEPSLAANQDLCRTRPLLEEELTSAISTLKESTTAIEKHVESLQRHTQHQLLHPFKRKPDRPERPAQDLVASIGRKDALELQQLRLAVGEEIVAFNASLDSAFVNALQVMRTEERQLTQLLHDNDQALQSLQKLAPPRGAVPDTDINADSKSLQLVNMLVKFTCEEMQCRLDRIYLEQLHMPSREEYGVEECPSDQELSLQSDLDSLYAEIRDVVAMSVAQEFEQPLIKSRQEDRQHQHVSEDLSNQYIHHTLSRSRQSLQHALDSLESFYSYSASLEAMEAIYHSMDCNAELTTAHESLLTPVAQESPMKKTASRALLRQIGIANNSSINRQLLEHELSNKMMKFRAHTFSSTSSANESLRSILDINNTSSQLLFLGHLETGSAVSLDNNLRALNDRIGIIKETVEIVEMSRAMDGMGYNQFLDRWAGSALC